MDQKQQSADMEMSPQEQQREQQRQLNQYISKLISGQVQAKNSFVASQIKKLRAAQADADSLRNSIEAFENDLASMKQRRLVLDGAIQSLMSNVAEWKDHVDPSPPEPKKEEDTAPEKQVVEATEKLATSVAEKRLMSKKEEATDGTEDEKQPRQLGATGKPRDGNGRHVNP